jgi:hypothetical protein
VNPDFKHLTTFLNSLLFSSIKWELPYIKEEMNLKVFAVDGDEYIVKSYKRPIWINRIIYWIFKGIKSSKSL